MSKGAYMKAHTERAALRTAGILLIFLMLFCGAVTVTAGVVCIVTCFMALIGLSKLSLVSLVSCLFALFSAALTYGCWRAMEAAAVQADQIHPGTPFTRANTADLPASDSLVRASVEPVQAQEDTLLRAATQGQETPSEQLVRAFTEQEDLT